MTEQELQKNMEEIEKLANSKKIQSQFSIMLPEYVEIAKLILKRYHIKNIPTVMANTYLRPFKTRDRKDVLERDKLIGGFHQNFFRKNTLHRISINPYDHNKEYSLEYLGNVDEESLAKIQLQVSSEEDLPKEDLLKAGKTTKLVDKIDNEIIAEGFLALENGLPPTQKENWFKEHTPKTTLTHEMFHSFAKIEFFKTTEQNESDFAPIQRKRDGKNFYSINFKKGGSKNIDLHEGMTEFLTKQMVSYNGSFYGYDSLEKYNPSYAPYVSYVANIERIFPGAVQDVYFNGSAKIGEYKNEFTSLKELFEDFETMDAILNDLNKKAKEPHSLIKSDLKDFEKVQIIYKKQQNLFDKLLSEKMIQQEVCDYLKNNLREFVTMSVLESKYNKIKIFENDSKELQIDAGMDLKFVLEKNKLTEKEIVNGKPLKELFRQVEITKGNLKLLALTKIKSPSALTLDTFLVTKETSFSLLPIKDEKMFDKTMFGDVIILKDGTLGFTKNFADLKLNGYNVDNAIKLSVKDGVLNIIPNSFYDDEFKEKTIFDVCQKEKLCEPDFETEFLATPAQTVGILNTLKVLGLDLMDSFVAPNVVFNESVMEKYFLLEEKNLLEKQKEKETKKDLLQKVVSKSCGTNDNGKEFK